MIMIYSHANLLTNLKAELYLTRSKMAQFLPNGVVFNAMVLCRSGTSANKAKECQPSFDSVDNLPWPLSVPWSGSFLISSNPSRDLIAHGIFGDIEDYIVSKYRENMIRRAPAIGQLRDDICVIFRSVFGEFEFADGIETPEYHNMGNQEAMLIKEKLSASYSKYSSQVEDIIKYCGKQSVILAHPFGDKDSVVVREAFEGFITVSGLSDCRSWLTLFIIGSQE
jgi:hypothetical protein